MGAAWKVRLWKIWADALTLWSSNDTFQCLPTSFLAFPPLSAMILYECSINSLARDGTSPLILRQEMELEQRMQIVSATGFALQQCFVLKELFQVVWFKNWLFSHDADRLVISLCFSLYQNGTKMWLKIFQTHQFRTSRPESLLVLVAGKTDYCLIMLQQGMLKVASSRRAHQPKDKSE